MRKEERILEKAVLAEKVGEIFSLDGSFIRRALGS